MCSNNRKPKMAHNVSVRDHSEIIPGGGWMISGFLAS